MNRAKFMVVHGADPGRWAARYGIEPFTHPCRCGLPCTTSIPFFRGRLRGLLSPTCPCGNDRTPYCAVSVDGDVLRALETMP